MDCDFTTTLRWRNADDIDYELETAWKIYSYASVDLKAYTYVYVAR